MPEAIEARIDRMHRRDCVWALAALAALWVTIGFVFIEIARRTADTNIVLALGAGAAVLLLFNTAAIVALLRHYQADKVHLYGLDIFYVDAMRAAAREARNGK